jgi:LDH2 family malate/lactate/ureidoglycolate dehydrogenase
MIPGDREYRHYDENLVQGVSIDPQTLTEMQQVGAQFGVAVPAELKASLND